MYALVLMRIRELEIELDEAECNLANMYLDCDNSKESFDAIEIEKEVLKQIKEQLKINRSIVRDYEKR